MKIPPPALPSTLSEILAYGFWMRREGYRPSTIQAAVSTLKALAKKAPLLNPDTVKTHLVSRKVSDSRKEKICVDLARFYKFMGIPFQMPRYRRIDTIPFVPLERASVTITPEKGSNARQLRISGHLIAMLNALPHKYEYCFRNPKIDSEKSMRTYQKIVALRT